MGYERNIFILKVIGASNFKIAQLFGVTVKNEIRIILIKKNNNNDNNNNE